MQYDKPIFAFSIHKIIRFRYTQEQIIAYRFEENIFETYDASIFGAMTPEYWIYAVAQETRSLWLKNIGLMWIFYPDLPPLPKIRSYVVVLKLYFVKEGKVIFIFIV